MRETKLGSCTFLFYVLINLWKCKQINFRADGAKWIMHLIIVSSMFCMQWCCCYCCYACTIFTPFSLSSSTLLVHYDYIVCLFIFHTFSWGILIQSICFDCVIFHHVKSLLHSCNIFLYISLLFAHYLILFCATKHFSFTHEMALFWNVIGEFRFAIIWKFWKIGNIPPPKILTRPESVILYNFYPYAYGIFC